MNAASVALLLAFTTTTTIVLAAPAPDAGGGEQADGMAPTKWKLWSYEHIHISNELGSNAAMTVHCTSFELFGKKEDMGVQHVAAGAEYKWQFKPPLVFGKSKYWCVVSPVDNDVAAGPPVHAGFFAYDEDDRSIFDTNFNVYWAVRPDGVYMRDVSGGIGDLLKSVWIPGNP
ncbi:unnamed protein product [Linum trigynum]|uniref:S-protein homolog n=1 Tax=Linum trigynum TaxID=586398 RepID=A0AAV2D1N0_9ROSI